ncbi:Atp-binding protein [Globisporangium polare]
MSTSRHLLTAQDPAKEKAATTSGYGTLPSSTDSRLLAPVKRSCWSALADTFFFTRGTRIYEISQQRARDVGDVLELQPQNSTRVCFEAFNEQYEAHGQSVLKALIFTHGRILSACAFGYLFLAGVTVFAPVVLQQVVLAFTTTDGKRVDRQNVCLWLAVFIASRLVKSIVSTQTSYGVNIVGLRVAATMRSTLFRKAMRKSLHDATSSQTATANGSDKHHKGASINIMNLATADVRTLQNTIFQGFNVLAVPIQIAVTTYLLYSVLSYAAFAGVGVILTTLLLNYAISRKMTRAFAELMKIQDARMKTVREMFSAIQIVKFNAWEPRFKSKLLNERAQELRKLAVYSYTGAASTFLSWSSPLLVSTISFAVYALVLKETLTAAKVFTSMALFNILRDPLVYLPDTIQLVIQSSVSIKRFDSFLKLSEFKADSVTRVAGSAEATVSAVQVINGQFSWSSDLDNSSSTVLKDVNLRLEKGDFAVVFGGVGASKSSLCSALLGEMSKADDGQVVVNGRVAYYSQQPWIQNMSIKSNILFGEAFDADRYDAVLDACCLREDLALFPAGDETEIGEKGVNLSGGQKARVALARACYAQADIYILDSPLAAVDTVVQKAIFQKCLCGLLAEKTVLLVTHNPEIIASKFVTCRIGLSNGMVVENTRDSEGAKRGADYGSEASGTKSSSFKKTGDGVLIHKENREEGQVSGAVWWHYIDAIGGLKVLLLLLVSQLLWQGFQIASNFWLSHWTGSSQQEGSVDFFIETYAGLAAAAAVMVFVKGVIVTYMGLRASRYLFASMTDGLLYAPLRFFDANPIGRIINRYGGDINAVDVVTPMNMSACMSAVFTVVCSVLTATVVIRSMSICLIPVVYIYAKIIDGYVRTFRDIRRLMGVVVSPILSHMAQSEHGVETIRAFGEHSVQRAINENEKRIDSNSILWYSEVVMIQWFSLRMQLLCVSFLSVICGSFVVFSDSFSPGIVGLAFTYALSVDASLVTLVKTWSRAENSMVNVERVLEYSSLECEGESDNNSLVQIEPSASWPQRGEIAFECVSFSYKPNDPLVLKQVSFAIKSHEKVGIVGRTGAGKSSLTMALFRMNDLVSGRILIDGVDIAMLPLSVLRSRMSIIPQSPVLLEGSLRNFLDPFDDFQNDEILQMLEHVELLSTLQGYCEPTSAEYAVLSLQLSANGNNWSVGERQMLCMARALLKRSTIVVMDEATAAMDHETERKLSAMIARELKGVTLLTIAHRLATVMASDRIMVLHEGQVVEFGSPGELLATGDGGVFYGLVQEAKHTRAEKE